MVHGFERNEHGHYIFELKGAERTGAAEIEWLIDAGYRISDFAKLCLASTKQDGYDAVHRLVEGQWYKIALMPNAVIKRDRYRTTANLRQKGSMFGYQQPLAGIIPRIREEVSDDRMKELGLRFITALHEPITDSFGEPHLLYSGRNVEGPLLGAGFGSPDLHWRDGATSAFLVAS